MNKYMIIGISIISSYIVLLCCLAIRKHGIIQVSGTIITAVLILAPVFIGMYFIIKSISSKQ